MNKQITCTASQVLDGVRSLAALAVFVGHLRNLFLVDFKQLEAPPSLFVRSLYFFTGFGHQAVIVFFVLSGYFIATSIVRSTTSGKGWSWINYGLQRLTRLYIVLIPALLLGALWDFVGMSLTQRTGIYTPQVGGEYASMLAATVPAETTVSNWFGSLLFLQGIACSPFGSNGPLWSLSYEFWYYLLFPLGYLAVKTDGSPRTFKTRIGMLVLGMLVSFLIGPSLRLYFCIWLLGACVAFAPPVPVATKRLALGIIVVILAACLMWSRLARGSSGGEFTRDALLGIACAAALYVLLCQQHGTVPTEVKSVSRFCKFGGDISFSLYLLHVPFLVFVNGQAIGMGNRWLPDTAHLAAAFGILVVTLAYVIIVWQFTEAKTDVARRYVAHKLLQTSVVPGEAKPS